MATIDYPALKQALEAFGPYQPSKNITPQLNSILASICNTGLTCWDWNLLKSLLLTKFEQVVDTYPKTQETPTDKNRIFEAILRLDKMCELLLTGTQTYNTSNKFIFAFEKTVGVVISDKTYTYEAYAALVAEQEKGMALAKTKGNLPSSPALSKSDDAMELESN